MSLALGCEWRRTVNLPEKERKKEKGKKERGKRRGQKQGGKKKKTDRLRDSASVISSFSISMHHCYLVSLDCEPCRTQT